MKKNIVFRGSALGEASALSASKRTGAAPAATEGASGGAGGFLLLAASPKCPHPKLRGPIVSTQGLDSDTGDLLGLFIQPLLWLCHPYS